MTSQSFKFDLQTMSMPQQALVRQALRQMRRGGGIRRTRKELSWFELAVEIDELTSVVELRQSMSKGATEDADDILQSIARQLRRFLLGEPQGSGHYMIPIEPTRSCIIEYVMHPRVKALTPEALRTRFRDFTVASMFADFLWQHELEPEFGSVGFVGLLATSQVLRGSRVTKVLNFGNSGQPHFNYVRESWIDCETGDAFKIRDGWSVFSDDNDLFVFLIEAGSLLPEQYYGQFSHSSGRNNHVQVLFRGVPFDNIDGQILSLAQSYVNTRYREAAPEPRQFVEKWGRTESENVLFYKVLDGKSGLKELGYGTISDRDNGNRWGPNRFYNPTKSTTEEIVNDGNKDKFEKSAKNNLDLIAAIKSCDRELFVKLLNEGADVNQREPKTYLTPLHYVAMFGRRFEYDLLKSHAELDVLVRDHLGQLPSLYAAGLDDHTLADELTDMEAVAGAKSGVSANVVGEPYKPSWENE